MSAFKYIGKPIAHSDILDKVTGRATFATDLKIPDMLYGKILRSPCAHALVKRIDTSRAEKITGVKAVLTRDDVEGKFGNYGMVMTDQSIVALDKVRYVGDPVAAAAAVDPFTAEEALRALDVEYEELPSVLTIDDALAPNAPLVHDMMLPNPVLKALLNPVEGTNICTHFKVRQGDVHQGFNASDFIFEDTFTTEPVQHATLEPHCSLAKVIDGQRIELWSNNQDPSNLQAQLSQIFHIPLSSIRIVVPCIGGGFGAKIGPKLEPITVALAWKARRPVRVSCSREEDFFTISRHGSRVRIKTGVKKDGTMVAREISIYFDKGAYADIGPVVSKNSGFSAGGPYRIPHVKIDAYNVYTNKIPAGAMRGFGIPQVAWAYEQQMDIIAEKLGIDPLALRKKNLLQDRDTFYTGEVIEDVDFGELMDKVALGIGWHSAKKENTNKIRSRGKGISIGLKGTATPSTSNVLIKMHADGSVSVICNTVNMGQGIHGVFKQIIAEELGLPLEKVLVLDPDVSVAPFDTGTYSSRSTFHMGNAILLAVEDLKNQLLDSASVLLNAEKVDMEFSGGSIAVKEMPDRAVPLAQAVRGAGFPRGSLTGRGLYQTKGTIEPGTAHGVASFYWMSAGGGVELEVDRETGSVKIIKYVGAVDAGKMINPMNVEQQNISSIVMSLGQIFTERMIYDPKGALLNSNFVDYKIPTAKDLPDEMIVIATEVMHHKGPYGAKGIGEVMIVPPMAAVANALYQATGIRFKDLPLTREKILLKLIEMEEGAR